MGLRWSTASANDAVLPRGEAEESASCVCIRTTQSKDAAAARAVLALNWPIDGTFLISSGLGKGKGRRKREGQLVERVRHRQRRRRRLYVPLAWPAVWPI